jgi:uncharacterized protein (DUF1800 family)
MPAQRGPWAPYEPTPQDPWDLRKVAHLHRRAGFGATRAELLRDRREGPAASVARLLRPREETAEEREVLAGLRDGVRTARDSEGERLQAYWLYRLLFHPDALREKLTLFWHGHFATSNAKVKSAPQMLRQNELLRRHALGAFPALLEGVVADPAMLVWLDGGASRKEAPNENFAREFLELFTLGVGHYTEADVRAAAQAFTGWAPAPKELGADRAPRFRFQADRSDDGAKTFLGNTGPWKAADVVRIALEQPAAAEFLCRKLYRFFVADEGPPAELIRPLADELRAHGYSVGPVVGTILRSRHFYSAAAYRRRIKGPLEFSAGLLRTLEVPGAAVRLGPLARACAQQGQDLFYPPGVKGWDGGRSWVTSATLLARGNWVADVVWGNDELDLGPYDPLAWARGQGLPPEQATEGFIDLLLQGDLPAGARALALRAGRDGRPDGLRKAIQILLHCPEYQLA